MLFFNSINEKLLIWGLNLMILKDLSDNEEIVFNLKTGVGIRFSGLELTIWKMAEGRNRIKDIILRAAQEFTVDKKRVVRDVLAFVKKMLKEGLFVLSEIPKVNGG